MTFAKTTLSERSGYEFYFTEPLINFCTQYSGLKNFDILLFNEFDRSAIFIECKTSINPGEAENDLKIAIKLVEDKLDYLSQIIGVDLEKDKIEYALCIYEKDRDKFEQAFKSNSRNNSNTFKLWIYSPHLSIIRLYLDHSHTQPVLSGMLKSGYGAKNLKNRFELPYIISSHKFSIIQRAIITECYNKNLKSHLEGLSTNDPKIIKIDDILKVLMARIVLGIPNDSKEIFIREKLGYIIQYGEKYKLFEKINDEYIRLICSGTNPGVVLRNVKSKFMKNYIDEKSEDLAKKEAMKKFMKKKGRTIPLTEF